MEIQNKIIPVTIAIDFDGTCTTHEFPEIGKDIGAVPVLRELVSNGHRLILFTMRSDIESPQSEDPNIIAKGGNYLTAAVNWFTENGLPLYGIQTNPTQRSWTTSPKCYAELFIDDAGLGIPLSRDRYLSSRPYVDWVAVMKLLVERGLIKL